MFRILLLILTLISLVLPILSYRYFMQLMKLVKIRRSNFLVAGSATILTGYVFFMLPWIFVGTDILAIRVFSYYVIMAGLLILVYAVVKIYIDWREVMK
ncbi:MAG: hypothetical protein DRN21_04590 [Thermoplasmata archaeon]|nr:MAG: hypothetical protein FE046_02005 [Thermoplasmata archaeon]RLF33986.1 MAG: hypothetical protein DRN07_01100 [Thermoplasmata archaeon]RLF38773.1 MAG: hypothetical protein DRN21_04590 [Thermoplasmata archaeon]HDN51381.1 hypothetical protein [Thermoplasmatales archaeon]